MLNWLRSNKKAALVASAHSPIKDETMQKLQRDPNVVAAERESHRKHELSQIWINRVQESLHLHLFLQFPRMTLGHLWGGEPIKSVLRPIKLIGEAKEYPKGSWDKQKLVIHFKDTNPAIEGYRPIVSQLGLGLYPFVPFADPDLSEVLAFTYAGDDLSTPRLARRHQLRLVKDLTDLGVNLNQQLVTLGFRITHINLERRSHDRNAVPTGNYGLIIDATEEVKYSVAIPAPSGLPL